MRLSNDKPTSKRPRKPRTAANACTTPATKPKAVKKTPIAYTPSARAAGLQGRLVLRAFVDVRGEVTKVKVLRSVGKAVDDPAAATLRTWTFDPAVACGKPVASQFTIARDFQLGD